MDLVAQFRAHLVTLGLPSGRVLVAVSGGPDSLALLELLLASSDLHRLELVVAHVDHGIHPDSAAVADRVRELATRRGLECVTGELRLGPHAGETESRVARYRWLEATRKQVGAAVIFLGHHADDQAETVLMRALEGSGAAGLAGMAAVSGGLVRPLLPFRREMLARYVQSQGLSAWTDPANDDPRHLRSWLRREILPLVRARLPEVDGRLIRLGSHAARDRAAWDAVLELLPGLDLRAEDDGISVAGAGLGGYDSTLAETVIMAVARRAGCRLGPTRSARVVRQIQAGISGSEVPLGDGWRAEVAFGRLRLVRARERTAGTSWVIAGDTGEGVWGRWRIRWRTDRAPERQRRAAMTAWFTPDPLVVRGWSPGERVRPLAGAGRRLIVRCFQDARVPRRRRVEWPVLASGGSPDVVWIPGVCRSDALLPPGGTEAVRVDAEFA